VSGNPVSFPEQFLRPLSIRVAGVLPLPSKGPSLGLLRRNSPLRITQQGEHLFSLGILSKYRPPSLCQKYIKPPPSPFPRGSRLFCVDTFCAEPCLLDFFSTTKGWCFFPSTVPMGAKESRSTCLHYSKKALPALLLPFPPLHGFTPLFFSKRKGDDTLRRDKASREPFFLSLVAVSPPPLPDPVFSEQVISPCYALVTFFCNPILFSL